MESRTVLSVVFLTLSWGFMCTHAQNVTNTTTAPDNTTATATTTLLPNATTPAANVTTPAANATTPVAAAAANVTTPAANATTLAAAAAANVTTPAANATTPAANATTPVAAAATNATTAAAAATTPAPTLLTNTTVFPLETDISRAGCRTDQLCAAQPAQCDPSTSGSCFFLAARNRGGQNFELGLAGESDGYIAASFKPAGSTSGNDTTYICANNGGVVKFISALLNNGQLINTTLPANSVKGKVNGKKIQCTFVATLPEATTRATTNYDMTVSTGPYNAASDSLGTPTAQIRAAAVDLTNPNTTVVNQLATTSLVSKTGCGSTKLCASEPASCDPATSGSCLFFSANQSAGQTFNFELSGQSTGFIAASLSLDTVLGGNDTTYACANNNGSLLFVTGIYNGNSLTSASNQTINGTINGNTIQCTFSATVTNTSALRASLFSIILSNGTFNLNNLTLGPFVIRLISPVVDLANPNTIITNLLTPNTTSTPTTNHAITHQQSLMQALLITVGILVLTMLGGK